MVLRLLLPLLSCSKAVCSRMATQRLLLGVMMLLALLYTLHVSSYTTNRRWRRPTPDWMKRGRAESCRPTSDIAFLKTHKCASSAIQNILFRYGLRHNLHFALPDFGNYFGGGLRPFHSGMLVASPWYKLGVNIMAIHTKWDHLEVERVMPRDTVYLTIVREPADLFESLYVYTNMEKVYNKTVEEYVLSVPAEAPRHHKYIGYNQMVWDLGMPEPHMNNLTAVQHLVRRAEEQFNLVMVADRMEESLVLMSHLLCWNLTDVLVLKVNARSLKFKRSMSPEVREVLTHKLASDYLVYDHFVRRFDELVHDFGRERMAGEVARLRLLTDQLTKTCGFVKKESSMMAGAERPSSNMVDGYKAESGNSRCTQYTRTELSFINLLRGQHRMEVARKFGLRISPGVDALPLGPHMLENPGNIAETINSLKKVLTHTDQ
ncbi:galactosylceramide sulfotransferase-like isoform X2 [Panulirus ornatus]|uniref:galactosylceramide sulfotransferase-like isoform X2 n=1 Tax=Panulirus ornatus TaxID=150431 RepID=UPI003A8379D4